MRHLTLLTLFLLTLLACGDGVNLITTDVVENIAGCYDEMETTDNHYIVYADRNCVDFEIGLPTPTPTTAVSGNPPVALPTDANWELIATLQRNPLRPFEFYLFEEDNDAIATAYIAGKHFIFEIGGENRSRQVGQARYYIIQPEPPFQDKDALQAGLEQRTGFKSGLHTYKFQSSGWYVTKEQRNTNWLITSPKATGFVVEFSEFIKPTATIRLNSDTSGNHYIREWARLRVYVSK